MSRIRLADDSPGALRLGEQILTSHGIEVVSVTDGAIALRRLEDVDPDLLNASTGGSRVLQTLWNHSAQTAAAGDLPRHGVRERS